MKFNLRLKSFLFALFVTSISVMAQDDVTRFFLSNYGFDSDFHYTADSRVVVKEEIREIKGWTADLGATYTITGVYEFGFGGTFNGATVPSVGYDGEAGGGLALSTGWDVTFCYYQTVTLPAGTYTINVPTYNGKSVTSGTSKLSWIPDGGTAVESAVKKYAAKAWTLDQITFTLSAATTGKIQIGYKSASGGSANSANLVIDYVQILGKDMAVDKSELKASISVAEKLYGEGTGVGADVLKSVLDAASSVCDSETTTMVEVLDVTSKLDAAIETYWIANATEDNPLDRSHLIENPSFEDYTNGWDVISMGRQTNTVFTLKKGDYYLEKWADRGKKIPNASVSQVIKDLPKGRYQLIASALHIQQTGSGSTINSGNPQTGATLYAGMNEVPVTAMAQYTVNFSVVGEKEDVEIGLKAVNPTGNFLCVDNFRLQYVGGISSVDCVEEMNQLIAQGEELIALGIQNTVAIVLREAMEKAATALKGTGTDAEGNIVYDQSALDEARTGLVAAIEEAKISRSHYDSLKSRIDYANKVVGWWDGEPCKATTLASLKVAIEESNAKLVDYSLTVDRIDAAITALNTKVSAVDKKIYCSGSACGSDEKLKNPNSLFSYERSMQSKHWVVFWESDYGLRVPNGVENMLKTADEVFELYADKLGFLTINQGKSKTDDYKMIIRLRYKDEWEANGSGIDNKIGMLTLSRWAYSSRGGQTLAHEIGHCFQYQVHCDNGDWRGWMFNWGKSTQNPFWEMCAQWMAYAYLPQQLFDNEWFHKSINNLHRHPLAGYLRYENYFIQNLFVQKHGWDAVGRLWNECDYGEDPFQTYMRTRMTGTEAQKLNQLGDEMWEWGARMTTFDFDAIRDYGKSRILYRKQTAMTEDEEGYWCPDSSICIENWANNAIRLNVSPAGKKIYAEFVGEAGKEGYTAYNITKAGWRYGFVAHMKDGTRMYSDIATADYTNPDGVLEFEYPANCANLWLVVSGAPTAYWNRDMINWLETTAEQWPYKVKFHQTNLYGKANNNTFPTAIESIESDGAKRIVDNNVYSLTGQKVRQGTTSLEGLPEGIYIVNGKKILNK